MAMFTPARPVEGRNVLEPLQHRLHPVSAFVVVPLFALANAGVDLHRALPDALDARLTWAVATALVVGKTIGIAGAALVACRLGIGMLPSDVTVRHLWGLGMLAGMGFTVSLFITDLAFHDETLIDQAKLGIFTGSLLGALLGAATLLAVTRRRVQPKTPAKTGT
jgi:NhaA family Na+:H+ antiporter